LAPPSPPTVPEAVHPPPDPDAPACVFHLEAWPDGDAELRFRPADPPFAYGNGKVSLVLPTGDPGLGFPAEIEGRELRIHGILRREDVPLRLARARTVSQVLTLLAGARLQRWHDARPDAITLEYTSPGLVLREPSPLVLRCDDLWIGAPPPPPGEGLPPAGRPASLSSEHSIPFAATPGGRTMASLSLRDQASPPSWSYETVGREIRVAVALEEAVLVGWVPSGDVHPLTDEILALVDVSPMRPSHPLSLSSQGVRCRGAIELSAKLVIGAESERHVVGTVAAGAFLQYFPAGRHDDFTAVSLPGSGLSPATDAELLVDTAALERCQRGEG